MSFWDNVKKFAQPYADEDYDDYDDEEMDEFEEEEEVAPRPARRAPAFSAAPESVSDFGVTPSAPAAPVSAPSSGFSGQVLNMHSGKQEVVLFHAKAFDDAAKAADELLTIRGVDASFVIYTKDDGIYMSARSLGEINVQVILEALGGGGNSTTAGGQVSGMTASEAKEKLLAAIESYLND